MIKDMQKEVIKKFFNNGGYVLDFSTIKFSQFSLSVLSKDIMISGLSKGKSFDNFIDNSDDDLIMEFVSALIDYFNIVYPCREEYLLNENMKRYLSEIVKLLDGYKKHQEVFYNEKELKKLNPEYIGSLIEYLIDKGSSNPNIAIGQSKDLVEAVIKDILENMGISYSKKDKFNQLFNKVRVALELQPVKDKTSEIDVISSKILGGLGQVVSNMLELRNKFGAGHGKGNKQSGSIALPDRYANLSIRACGTVISFLIETYNNKYKV